MCTYPNLLTIKAYGHLMKKNVQIKLQRALNELEQWCANIIQKRTISQPWHIKLNPTKTNLLPLTRIKAQTYLTLYSTLIISTQTAKLLRTTFDKTISLHSHTHNLVNKANRWINLLRLVKGNQLCANPETLMKHSKPISDLFLK